MKYVKKKRILDFIIAFILAIPASIIILFCTLVIKVESKCPAFFKQIRPGYKGKLFTIYKLRTMNNNRDENGKLLPDIDRITKSGNIIRKCSFDELPQIWNVLKGDMAFIGPRPLLPQYLKLYSPEQMRRHDVLPGISGYTQVHGRNSISWKEKFNLDIWYVDHISFKLDCQIFFDTIVTIINRKGINQSGETTMEGFNGYN